jgi:hypothetical protein
VVAVVEPAVTTPEQGGREATEAGLDAWSFSLENKAAGLPDNFDPAKYGAKLRPRQFVSLLDVLRAYAYVYSAIIDKLWNYQAHLEVRCANEGDRAPIGKEQSQFIPQWLEPLRHECAQIGLEVAVQQIIRFHDIEPAWPVRNVCVMVASLRQAILDHLLSRQFLYVPPALAEHYQPAPFWADVVGKFPMAVDDTEAAGKCLAVGQGTACVFHLMRAMEVGLKALAENLEIPYAPSWESYLRQINDRVHKKPKLKSVEWKRDESVYLELAGDLSAVKMAWRNPTMHVQRSYDVEQAGEIYLAVRRFMQDLAKKLP